MRIIGGRNKGRKLDEPKGEGVRPTLDRVKESLFNILQSRIYGCRFLDLFGGTGAIGAEAVSRGASEVVVIEKDKTAFLTVKSNLQKVEGGKAVNADAIYFLENTKEKFDVIYIDPPYQAGLYEKVLEIIYRREILNADGIIVCESEEPFSTNYFEEYDQRKYGRAYLIFLRGNI